MLEKENLTPFQIQLLLYYLTAEPSKRTVTDSARSLNVSKWVVTRTLDTLEKLNIVERLENRKTVLTVPGVKLAEKYQKQRKVLEKYMQYQDIPPAQIKMVTGYTEFALRKMRIIKAVYFIIRSPVWSLRPDRRVTGEQSQKQYDNNDPPLKNSERSNFLGD